jgi:polysaccharide export outer membrane protein
MADERKLPPGPKTEYKMQETNMLKQLKIAAILGLALMIPQATARAQAKTTTASAAMPAIDATRPAATTDPNYVIGAQDVLDVSVWKEPDLSKQVPVRPDGKISLPLLNDVQAGGLTPTQLAAQITAGLEKYMTSPQVTVIVSQINSQRIYILGEVTRVGAYVLLPGMTVLQALSNAGGFTAFSNVKAIYVLRQDNGKQAKIPFNYKEVVSGKKTEQNIELKAGDTIVVP